MGEQDQEINPKSNGDKRPLQDPVTGRFVEGNPGGGRPKGSISITDAIRKKLEEIVDPETKRTRLDRLVEQILLEAEMDNTKLKELIWAYLDGKPMNNINLTSGKGKEDRESLKETLNKVLNGDIDTSDKKQDIEGSSE